MGGWPSAAWLCTARERQQEQINKGKTPSYTVAMTAVLSLTTHSYTFRVSNLFRPTASLLSLWPQINVSIFFDASVGLTVVKCQIRNLESMKINFKLASFL